MASSQLEDVAVAHDFQKLSETIGTNIQKISQNVSSMKKLINQLNFSQESQEVWTQYNQIQNYTQKLAKDTSASLKVIMNIKLSSPDHRQNKLSRERLSEEFISALNNFQETQRLAARKNADESKKIKATITITDPFVMAPPSSNQLVELDRNAIRMQEQMQIQAEEEIRRLEMLEPETRQLESNIVSLNEIFKDLATLVHDEGEIVDSIEANINMSCDQVQSGTHHLQQAATYQNKSRKKKLIFIIILAVILSIIGIVLFSK